MCASRHAGRGQVAAGGWRFRPHPAHHCPLPCLAKVPKTTNPFPLHPKSGTARFNLTFRRLKPQWAERVPLCSCGRLTQMKARQPRQLSVEGAPARELTYFYACEQGKGCREGGC